MSDDWVIREATVDDIAHLAHHRVAMFREMGDLRPEVEEPLRAAFVAWLRQAMPRGEYRAWVAVAGDAPAIVAGAGLQLRSQIPRPVGPGSSVVVTAPLGHVVNVYTEVPWRRRGVAEAVMRALVAEAETIGLAALTLHATAAGRPLYEKLGFAVTNEMRRGIAAASLPHQRA